MGNSLIQPSMAGGELAPALHGRVDLARYQTSLKTCRNFIAQQYGGVTNRPGTKFVAEVANSAKRHRAIDFTFSTEQTYVLIFGDLTMQVVKDGGMVESSPGVVMTVVTPFTEADLPDLNWTQSADVLTVVHPDHAPQQISRTSHTAWTVTEFANVNGPFQDINSGATTVYASAAAGVGITLTASAALFDASMIGLPFYIEQKDYGQPWAPGVAVAASAIRRSDDKYYITVAGGTTGSEMPIHEADIANDGGVEWTYLHPGFGYCTITAVASSVSATATVVKRIPDGAVGAGGATYKWAKSAWGGDQGYPSAVTYFQNRQVFGGSTGAPQSVWMSKVGNYVDFGYSQPTFADDAIKFPIPGRQVNAVRHLLPLDKLAILTSGSEWVLGAGQDDVIAPDTIAVKSQGYRGTNKVPPLVIGNNALHIQDKGKTVRELGYDYSSDSYKGGDLTVLASHLFLNYTLEEWAYQQVPFQVAWCVRSDGTLLGLTYLKEQEVVAWHQHDTDGEFESVACIAEDGEDVLYAIVKRVIDGATVRYIERMNTRLITDVADAFFVDSGLTYDGRNTAATTMTISGAAWTYDGTTFTVTASGATFVVGDVGSEVHFPLGTQVIRILITGFTSGTVVTGTANRDIPAGLQAVATADWSIARTAFAGLDHLEGEICNVLADGNVHPQVTVSAGAVLLDVAAAVVHVGLPITADIETLSINMPGQETLLDKKKIIPAVRLLVENTVGLKAGPDADHLVEIKQRATENYDQPTAMLTGIMEVRIASTWSKAGRVFLRQSDPLPASVLAIIPEITSSGV